MTNEQKELSLEIEGLRRQLDQLISSGDSLQDEQVLRISARLDELILRYSALEHLSADS